MKTRLLRSGATALLAALACQIPERVFAGAWTLPRNHAWCKVAVLGQTTHEEYVGTSGSGRGPDPERVYHAGNRAPYRFSGRYRSRALFFDLFYGATDRIDVGLQLPFFRQEYQDTPLLTGFGEPRRATGFGDVRGFLKVNVLNRRTVGTLKLGFKAPSGEFVNEDGLIPVGEGQWDFEAVVQLGRSFWPKPVYANADVGYRLRLRNAETDRDPGNEWTFLAEAGVQARRAALVGVKIHGIRGGAATVFGARIRSDIKKITYISPVIALGPFHGFTLETAMNVSVHGRNYPAGWMAVIGLSYQGSAFPLDFESGGR
ncbi:MAG: transporter [Gemmatimonadota bacterium]|nr:transporter [Gemmatimonadota bacterium]